MKSKLIKNISECYGLSVLNFLPAQKGYRNHIYPLVLSDGSTVCIIIFKSEPDSLQTINNADKVANLLQAKSLPVRTRFHPKLLKLIGKDIHYAGVYHYLPGKTIAWEAYSQGHLKVLGKTMSDMHSILENSTITNLTAVEDIYSYNIAQMLSYFSNPQVRSALQIKLGISINQQRLIGYTKLLDKCKKMSNRQPLHMDFVRGNILFSNDISNDLPQISGILDLEKTAMGHPIFDIARSLAFLLVDCKSKTTRQVYKYFLLSGYQKRGASKLSFDLKPLLQSLVDMFLLYDIYKFLSHNPYESLPQNQHFVRTQHLGLISGIIQITERGGKYDQKLEKKADLAE